MKNNDLPKLGRPFTGGSRREKYLKFYLTDAEMVAFERSEKELKKLYLSHGHNYNRPAHFRNLLFNLTNPLVIKALFDNRSPEIKVYYKMDDDQGDLNEDEI